MKFVYMYPEFMLILKLYFWFVYLFVLVKEIIMTMHMGILKQLIFFMSEFIQEKKLY